MDRKQATRLSKFLSLVLRHRPDEYGLQMDDQGFVEFESLIDVIVAEDIAAETAEDDVREIVEGSDRRRFEISDGRIRALYGHSSRVHLDYPEDDPPAELYHGTSPQVARRILSEGMRPAGRAYVHLSSTPEEAEAVGRRNADDPVIVKVDTAKAREEGVTFHQATDLIWLCPDIPAGCCQVPDLPEVPAPPKPAGPDPVGQVTPRTQGSSGYQIIQPDPAEGFKRRPRKKPGRR
jgi:putative RNA 2'-phosphotransferase